MALSAQAASLTYRGGAGRPAVKPVDLEIEPGAAVGIAGESGSGKTTLARMLVGMLQPTSGTVAWDGVPLHKLPPRGPGGRPSIVQMILQDPTSSLNPRMRIGDTLREALVENNLQASPGEESAELLRRVGLDPEDAVKYPFQLSGGQRQRVSIARALAISPQVLICDEITSALDVSVQASILNLLRELRMQAGTALVFVSHNLDVVRYLCDDVLVLLQGDVVERGPVQRVFTQPDHAYTRRLLAAVPRLGTARAREGAVDG